MQCEDSKKELSGKKVEKCNSFKNKNVVYQIKISPYLPFSAKDISLQKIHFSVMSNHQVESNKVHVMCEPAKPCSVKITPPSITDNHQR